MKRAWNQVRGPAGTGSRHADALAGIATEGYVGTILGVKEALDVGAEATITALRIKLDAEGNALEGDDVNKPGDYLTVGYRFEIGGDEGETYELEREPNYEGEQAADDYAGALAQRADRDFCEAMVQIKCILDRIGGRTLIRPFIAGEMVVGYGYYYEHIAKDQPREPDQREIPELEADEDVAAANGAGELSPAEEARAEAAADPDVDDGEADHEAEREHAPKEA
jgi:hypothetical protein